LIGNKANPSAALSSIVYFLGVVGVQREILKTRYLVEGSEIPM